MDSWMVRGKQLDNKEGKKWRKAGVGHGCHSSMDEVPSQSHMNKIIVVSCKLKVQSAFSKLDDLCVCDQLQALAGLESRLEEEQVVAKRKVHAWDLSFLSSSPPWSQSGFNT
jgi:hypothetical protein